MIPCSKTFEVDTTKPFMPFSGTGHCLSCHRGDEVFIPEGLERLGIKPLTTMLPCPACEQEAFIIHA